MNIEMNLSIEVRQVGSRKFLPQDSLEDLLELVVVKGPNPEDLSSFNQFINTLYEVLLPLFASEVPGFDLDPVAFLETTNREEILENYLNLLERLAYRFFGAIKSGGSQRKLEEKAAERYLREMYGFFSAVEEAAQNLLNKYEPQLQQAQQGSYTGRLIDAYSIVSQLENIRDGAEGKREGLELYFESRGIPY